MSEKDVREKCFRPSRNSWYVEIQGHHHKLGSDRDGVLRRYHELMAAPPKAPEPPPSDSVVVVPDRFLGWTEKHRSPDTYRWYKDRLQAIIDQLPRGAEGEVAQAVPCPRWIDGMTWFI